MTQIEFFTQDQAVRDAIDELLKTCKNRQYSDVVSGEAGPSQLQYVDVVMEGGGMLGIALVGYIYALEKAGIRFLGIGGTSAGSIAAMLLGALGDPTKPKAERLLSILANAPFDSFIDGDSDAQDFIATAMKGAGTAKLLWKGWQVWDNLTEEMGLNPGIAFTKWMQGELAKLGVSRTGHLNQVMTPDPHTKIYVRDERKDVAIRSMGGADFRVAIVAADVTTETKVAFPDMAVMYYSDPSEVNPAEYVRASMSIPFFFAPKRVELPVQLNSAAIAGWTKVGIDLPPEKLTPGLGCFVVGDAVGTMTSCQWERGTRVVPGLSAQLVA